MSPEEEDAFMHYLRFKKVPGKGLGHGGPVVESKSNVYTTAEYAKRLPDSLKHDESPKKAKQ